MSHATLTSVAATATRASKTRRGRAEPFLYGLGGVILFALAWEVLPYTGIVSSQWFPPLHRVLGALGSDLGTGEFWSAFGSTVLGWLLGLLIATVVGSVLGVLLGWVRILGRLLSSTIEFLRPIPSVALVPLVGLLFGVTQRATLVLVVFASLWPILIQVVYGVRDVDRIGLDTAASYRLGAVRTVRSIVWPSLMPYLIVGIRLAASVALVLEITGELVIGSPGLGKLITLAQTSAAIPSMYAYILVSALLGIVINVGSRALENRLLFWHASIRKESNQ